MYGTASPLPESTRSDSVQDGGSGLLTGVVAVSCVAFLAFVIGSFTMYRGFFPAEPLRGAFQGGMALYDRMTGYNDPYDTDFWKPARTSVRGVLRHNAVKAQEGLTLYTSADSQTAKLIDMNGRAVHKWTLPYSEVWDKSSAVREPQSDAFVHMEKTHVFPNGDLLALYTAMGDTPWGYGLVKMDKDSNVIWKYLAHAHHDFDIAPTGEIYVLTQEISKVDLPGFENLKKPRIDDFVVKLSPDGKELKRVWLTGALAQSQFGRKFYFVPDHHTGDYLHTNSVFLLDKPVPGIPQSKAGQVLVSFREISTIALLDLETSKIVWAQSGPWVRQHDAEFLADGHLLVFDNEGDPNGYGGTRVMEIDPTDSKVKWRYGGREDQPLDSVARGSQVRLKNGNTLIVESYGGRMFEVTQDGEVVWDFINPVRGGVNQDRIPIIHWAERLDPQRDFAPEFRRNLGGQ
ncbi:MAG: arylsulfotransferase family protein [Methyloceanibacter sp.]